MARFQPAASRELVGSVLGVVVGRLVWGAAAARPPVAYAALHPEPGLTNGAFFLLETLTMAFIILIVGVVLAVPRIASALPLIVGVLVGGAIAGLGTVTGAVTTQRVSPDRPSSRGTPACSRST